MRPFDPDFRPDPKKVTFKGGAIFNPWINIPACIIITLALGAVTWWAFDAYLHVRASDPYADQQLDVVGTLIGVVCFGLSTIALLVATIFTIRWWAKRIREDNARPGQTMDLAPLVASFIERQYVTGEGDVRQNVEDLFSVDLVYHAGAETLTREDLVAMGVTVRATPEETRRIHARDFEQEGRVVRWRLSAVLPALDGDDAEVRQDSRVSATFGGDGKIIEVRSTPAD